MKTANHRHKNRVVSREMVKLNHLYYIKNDCGLVRVILVTRCTPSQFNYIGWRLEGPQINTLYTINNSGLPNKYEQLYTYPRSQREKYRSLMTGKPCKYTPYVPHRL